MMRGLFLFYLPRNRNLAANPNLQGMMSGTVGRALTQLQIMRNSLGNILRDHGGNLPPEMQREARRLHAGISSSPF